MNDLETQRSRLDAMRYRLRRQLGEQAEEAYEVSHKDGPDTHLHTHNADMDVEGLDEVVAVSHALEQRLRAVDDMLRRIDADPKAVQKNPQLLERIDAILSAEEFAADLRDNT